MSQVGFTPISIYYSTTASAAPTAGNLVAGELAINTNDGILYYKDSSGVVQKLATKGGVGTSSTTQVLYNNAGLIAGSSNMTFNGTTLILANDASISGLTVGKGGGSGSTNTALGINTFGATNTGGYGTAIGITAGQQNTSGNQNTFIGGATGNKTTTGSYNSGVGAFTLYENTTGSYNNAFGHDSLEKNTTGNYNTAVGGQALWANTTASNNTAVGYQAGYSNTTGIELTLIGYKAGFNTTGGANTAVGFNALLSNTSSTGSTAIGDGSLYSTTGGNNTAIGLNSGSANTTGSDNTFIGKFAGNNLVSGVAGVYVGSSTQASGTGASYEIVIGYAATGKGSSTAFINANGGGTYNGANTTTWATTSDLRIKKNVVSVGSVLNKILALNPVEFDYKENDKHEVGFIAQEFEAVFPDQIITHEANEAEKEWVGEDKVKAIQQNLVPYLVKAIQELNAKLEAQELEIATLKGK